MATTRLLLYNAAVLKLGERQLSSITENREPRRVLDVIWDTGFVDYVLEQGLWNFAMRSVALTYSPSSTPAFGLNRAFDKPTDWVRTAALCHDEYFKEPLNQYADEGGFFYAEQDTIYLRYVSNDSNVGGDLSLWPQSFVKFAAATLAAEAAKRITHHEGKVAALEAEVKEEHKKALSKDAMNEPTAFPPRGSWTRSRTGRRSRDDRGGRGNLIG